jgi:23S rRNA (guanine745-N1)-methyltransferase
MRRRLLHTADKAHREVQFCVASAYQLPFADQSFDAIVRIYAPSEPGELQRLITQGGHLLSVSPGPQHLVEIKQAVYDQVRLHDDVVVDIPGFRPVLRQQLSFNMQINRSEDVLALIQMVPLAWKFTAEQKQQFADTLPCISADFLLDLYQRNSSAMTES